MALDVEDLSVSRGGAVVLAGVGFTLAAGSALLLRGPNGIGKTTLLRSIAGLQPVAAGRVRAVDLTYAGHADGIKSTLTVAENLAFWAAVHGGGEIDPALAAYELTRLRDRPAAQLSAGQKRRLGLARLLVTGRKLWLMDEPTVSLDAASVDLFAGVLRAHLAAGGAALIASHIDIGLEAAVLDLARFRAVEVARSGFDEAFA